MDTSQLKNRIKYLVFHSTSESEELSEKYTEHWDGIKNEIETKYGGKNVNMVKIL